MFSKVISFLLLLCMAYSITTTHTGCANIVPPVGGSRDSTAPRLQKVVPLDKALNVKSKTIVLDFDEYVELENASQNILISPLPKIPPEVNSRLKTVTIKLKDSLEENTTYSISINGAIKDVNEGNKLTDLVYTFSTGSYLDSNTISGKVILAETGKIDSTLIVVLYANSKDSAVVREKPKYFTNLNAEGKFIFKNLPAKQFSIYTLTDEGGQKRYVTPKQLFGFNNTLVNAATNPDSISLFAYIEEKEVPKPPTEKASTGNEKIRMTTSLSGGQQDILKELKINFSKKLKNIDTNKLILTDTAYTKIIPKSIQIDSNNKEITITTNWQSEAYYRLIIPSDFATDEKNNPLSKADTVKFITKNIKDYGKIIIRFGSIKLSENPVLQIVQGDNIISSYPLTAFKLTIPMFNPGDYDLRLLYDENKNGKWDPGSFFTTKKQPEKVTLLSKKLSVKADWDNELEID
jgi:hypothetical protein